MQSAIVTMMWTVAAAAAFGLGDVSLASTREMDEPYQQMVTKRVVSVHRAPNKRTAVIAKIHSDKQITVQRHSRMTDCPEGWYRRADFGFVCGKHLRPLREEEQRLSVEDNPAIREGFAAARVIERKAPVYRMSKKAGRLKQIRDLYRGSVLSGTPDVRIGGEPYFRSRQGHYVRMESVAPLPAPIDSLALNVEDGHVPAGIVTGAAAEVVGRPSAAEIPLKVFRQWQPIYETPLTEVNGYVAIPGQGFVRKADISLVRSVPAPEGLGSDERWIAVDLAEQLLYAFEGDRLIRLMPCSTGVADNTPRGAFTIQKKLRQQTLRLKAGKIRVEDVQWVMFFEQEEAIAIHSAFWHRDFGTPKSHGCVNLPHLDARWLYEWSLPEAAASDSVTLPLPRDSGTRVIVF